MLRESLIGECSIIEFLEAGKCSNWLSSAFGSLWLTIYWYILGLSCKVTGAFLFQLEAYLVLCCEV